MTVLTPTWREESARLLRLAAVYLGPARADALCAAQPEATVVAEFRRQWACARRSLPVLEDHNHTAHEYGVPAVIGCRRATQHIADGAILQVDRQAGVVTILASEAGKG